jgi:hypothetical protein
VSVHATAAAAPPTTIAINAGDAQSANAGTPVPVAPSVKVTDADGIGVSGVSVTFSIGSGGGSLTGASAVTNAQGIATVGSWTLGLGGNSIFASVPGLAGDPVTFFALGTAEVQIVTFGDSNTDSREPILPPKSHRTSQVLTRRSGWLQEPLIRLYNLPERSKHGGRQIVPRRSKRSITV